MISWPIAFVLVIAITAVTILAEDIHKRRHERKMKKLEKKAALDEKMLERELEDKEMEYNV